MTTVQSPLTGDYDVSLIRSISAEQLIADWMATYQIDVRDEFHGVEEVLLYQCNKTRLRFFRPVDVTGSEALYRKLQSISWYYTPHRWEHQIALKEVHGKVLEVGCGEGSFVKAAIKKGVDAQGIELNSTAVEIAQQNGLPVQVLDLQEAVNLYGGRFDYVCSFQVLEHVPNPAEFLRWCIQLLKPGGRLIVCVPNSDSSLKYRYELLDLPPHHMSQWTASTFQSLESLFKLQLEQCLKEPLGEYQEIDRYLSDCGDHFRAKFVGSKVLFNRYTYPLYKWGLRKGLRRFVKGQCLYAQLKRAADVGSSSNREAEY